MKITVVTFKDLRKRINSSSNSTLEISEVSEFMSLFVHRK